MTGVLVAVEGPNGSGKTAVCARLRQQLPPDAAVHWTTEPSYTAFGTAVRAAEQDLRGRAYALAIAADRTQHVEHEIVPQLDRGTHVVTDRYVQSSLVLQQVDGLTIGQIWAYNNHIRPADITFHLHVDPAELTARLADRTRLSRIERSGDPAREIRLYEQARVFLYGHGWRQETVQCGAMSAAQVAAEIADRLRTLFPTAGF